MAIYTGRVAAIRTVASTVIASGMCVCVCVVMYGGVCLNSHGDSQSQRQHKEILHTISRQLLYSLVGFIQGATDGCHLPFREVCFLPFFPLEEQVGLLAIQKIEAC